LFGLSTPSHIASAQVDAVDLLLFTVSDLETPAWEAADRQFARNKTAFAERSPAVLQALGVEHDSRFSAEGGQ
jgi:hypothetical protein